MNTVKTNQRHLLSDKMIAFLEIVIFVSAITISLASFFWHLLVVGVALYFLVNLGLVWFFQKTNRGVLGKMLSQHRWLKMLLCVVTPLAYPLVVWCMKLL